MRDNQIYQQDFGQFRNVAEHLQKSSLVYAQITSAREEVRPH